jgi:putative tricarboxylic transport membrane protein
VVPLIVGLILAPRAEIFMRRALQISDGHISGLVNTTFAKVVYVLVALVVLLPVVLGRIRGRVAPEDPTGQVRDDGSIPSNREGQ